MRPTISLVTPVLDGVRYFRPLLDALRNQQFKSFEYIVVDGGSTDGTLELLQSYPDIITEIIHYPEPGIYAALAQGFKRANGKILCWINSDDMFFPWTLQCVSDYFDGNRECHWITGIPTLFDESGRMVWCAQVAPRYIQFLIRRGCYTGVGFGPIQQEGVFFSRDLYERAGGLSTHYKVAGDFHLWKQFARFERLEQVGIVLAGFRLHGANRSITSGLYYDEARAFRIPAGKALGAIISFIAFLWSRVSGGYRLDEKMKKV